MKKLTFILVAAVTIGTASLPENAAQPVTNCHTKAVAVVEASWLRTPALCLKNPACRKRLMKKLHDWAQQLRRAGEILADKAIDLAEEVQNSIDREKDKPDRPDDAP